MTNDDLMESLNWPEDLRITITMDREHCTLKAHGQEGRLSAHVLCMMAQKAVYLGMMYMARLHRELGPAYPDRDKLTSELLYAYRLSDTTEKLALDVEKRASGEGAAFLEMVGKAAEMIGKCECVIQYDLPDKPQMN